jgi:predicted metal-dependent hydrolase
MKHKAERIRAFLQPFQGRSLDAHYLAFFACFNEQHFYEAHEVLEELWLVQRDGPNGDFYKGLIQLAGAFVHVQKGRPGPALALLTLAQKHLREFPATHQGLHQGSVLALIDTWTRRLTSSNARTDTLVLETAAELRLPVPDEAAKA